MALHGDDRPVLNAANLGPGLVAMRQALNFIHLPHANRSSQYNPFSLFLIDSATLSCHTPGNYTHMHPVRDGCDKVRCRIQWWAQAQNKARAFLGAHLKLVQHAVGVAQGLRTCGAQSRCGGTLRDAQQLRRRVRQSPLPNVPALGR